MRNLILALACLLFVPASALPGTRPPDDTILPRETVVTDAPGVWLERIVYASDGLEVEAYLAQPAEITAPVPWVGRLRGGMMTCLTLSSASTLAVKPVMLWTLNRLGVQSTNSAASS